MELLFQRTKKNRELTIGKSCFEKTESDISIYYVEPEDKPRKTKEKLPDRFFNFTRVLKQHNVLESTRTGSVAIS
jgi:acetolactate synthase small subunit